MIMLALCDIASYPLEWRCVRSKQRELLETYNHAFMWKENVTAERGKPYKNNFHHASHHLCVSMALQQAPKAPTFLHPVFPLSNGLLAPEIITTTLFLSVFSLSLEQSFLFFFFFV